MSVGAAPGSTTERLRADIDTGRTGDKVAASDPAAAPLGTDDEAAGRPASEHSVARARGNEVKMDEPHEAHERGIGSAWILIGFVALLSLAVLGWGVIKVLS